jgi:hypothetical protein
VRKRVKISETEESEIGEDPTKFAALLEAVQKLSEANYSDIYTDTREDLDFEL